MDHFLQILVADDQAQMVVDFVTSALPDVDAVTFDMATTPKAALAKVQSKPYDMILLDISFTPGQREGLELLPEIRLVNSDCAIVMLSSLDDRATIKRAMDLGATNYVVKALETDLDATILHVRAAIAKRRFARLVVAEGRLLAQNAGAIFQSSRTDDVLAKIARARRAKSTNVLITGQTGVGKDAVARAIGRAEEGVPFVTVNCASLSPELVESELFGYAKGAFTGAARDTKGLFDAANGGDIFLDEVARLSPRAQGVLLRVLQSGEFNPVGSTVTKSVKVRVIAATNEDLNQGVKVGLFREDLLARLHLGIGIVVPPLCERREDIRPIIEQTIAKSSRPSTRLTPECLAFLEAHPWPTNIRGLIGTITEMMALTEEDILDVSDIPKEILAGVGSVAEKIKGYDASATDHANFSRFEIPTNLSLDKATALFMARFIEAKIESLPSPRSVSALAVALDVPRTTLIRRLRELGIELEGDASPRKQIGGN